MFTEPIAVSTSRSQSTQSAPILFTDHETGFLSFYRMMMRSVRLDAIYTPSTIEVLQLCREQPVSLVVTNVMHSEMSGIELLRQLRSYPKTASIPVIFVTALDAHTLSGQLE